MEEPMARVNRGPHRSPAQRAGSPALHILDALKGRDIRIEARIKTSTARRKQTGGSRIQSDGGAQMAKVTLSEDLRSLSNLETQAPEVVQQARTTGRPVVLTREGHGVTVLCSVEVFEELQSSSERLELQQAVGEAERDIAEGHWVESSEVLAKLKRWSTVTSERTTQWETR